MKFLVSFVASIASASSSYGIIVDPKSISWQKMRGRAVMIVYENYADAQPIVRGALANDCDVELFDYRNIDYSWISYDKRTHRVFKAKHLADLPVHEPMLHRTSPYYSLWVLKGLERANHHA